MKSKIAMVLVATAVAAGSAQAQAGRSQGMGASMMSVTVGGQAMLPSRDIVDNAVNSADHTTLVAAVKAADLVQTLKGRGPFTVFAPVNDAFENLPEGAVATLLRPENKAALAGVLTYHVVPGRYTGADLMRSKAMLARRRRGRATKTRRRLQAKASPTPVTGARCRPCRSV